MEQFDRKLFEYLLPANAEVNLVEFTGSTKGSRVHLDFVSPIKATWVSDITEHGENESETWFIDEGTVLPFGLKYWKHRHIIRRVTDDRSDIIDDITFKFGNAFLTTLLFPAVYLGFLPRSKQYKTYFGK